ncbi:MAG: phosphoribosyltransferase [Crenarchaeota archaeon]|nr:phosphoribosyltransferase [Thermoproteota archaeon]
MDGSECSSFGEVDGVYFCPELSARGGRPLVGVFRDRWHAGRVLAGFLRLLIEAGRLPRPSVVYAIPAGGVPVGVVVAEELGVPLDVVVVKKVLYPWTTEAGFGAVAPGGVVVLDEAEASRLPGEAVEAAVAEAAGRVEERLRLLRGGAGYEGLEGEPVLVVDDGIAAGWTMLAACRFLRGLGASYVAAAAPTGSVDGCLRVRGCADAVAVVNLRGGPVFAVADAYLEWRDLSDWEVLEVLREAEARGVYRPRRGSRE